MSINSHFMDIKLQLAEDVKSDNLSADEMDSLIASYNSGQVESVEVHTSCTHGPDIMFVFEGQHYCVRMNIDFGVSEINKLKNIS